MDSMTLNGFGCLSLHKRFIYQPQWYCIYGFQMEAAVRGYTEAAVQTLLTDAWPTRLRGTGHC